jgi:diguanylate cyclase (GGDEF)-like protein
MTHMADSPRDVPARTRRGRAGSRDVAAEPPPEDLRRLGEALLARRPAIVSETIERTVGSGEEVEPSVQAAFERVCANSTVAVARWIAGEGLEVTVEASRETSQVFGEIAARRAASLHEVTRRSLWWRNVMADQLRACAADLALAPGTLPHALSRLQLSLEASMLRICECFEEERRRTDDALRRREEELAFLATRDPLTGLPNRTLIQGRMEQMLAGAARRARGSVTALFIDLDNFKSINDTLGHRAGDELLQAVAARLTAVVRDADALGRLGGDEFVVIAEELSAADGPEQLAERLLDALVPPFELGAGDRTSLTVTASIGIASGEGRTADELLRDADIAMYRAKWDGRNRHTRFEDGMRHGIEHRLQLELDLREALAEGQFQLVYQPTLRLREMRPTGAEALLRWQHPSRGLVLPGAFIPLLEETGMIADVGRWVLAQACLQAASWSREGHSIAVAVNVSARQLDSDRLLADVREALARSGLAPSALMIEVTETALMRSIEETAERLAAIRALGVRIAIDDFGTGYSSLAHLKRLPVDALKIDRSFVSGCRDGDQGRALLRALVQLGRALSIETVAEGIERDRELRLLRREGCDGGQGYLFARPLDADATASFFQSFRRRRPRTPRTSGSDAGSRRATGEVSRGAHPRGAIT